jgi:hypothetical protein
MKRDDETIEEFRNRIEIENKEKWICLGEVEEYREDPNKGFSCFECSDSPHNYLFRYKDNSDFWMYSIASSYRQAGFVNPFIINMELSPLTFLVMYISADREFGILNSSHIGHKCNNSKIRFVGMTEWLSVDDDFLNYRISLEQLEQKFRKI